MGGGSSDGRVYTSNGSFYSSENSRVNREDKKAMNTVTYALGGIAILSLVALGFVAYKSETFRQNIAREIWGAPSQIETQLNSPNQTQ